MSSEQKLRPARWRWAPDHGKSGLRARPAGAGSSGYERSDAVDRDVITTPIPALALREAARVMNEPEPPVDLCLYRALEESEPPPANRASRSAPPLAAELGLSHLLEAEGKPARSWSLWLRAQGLWVAAAVLVLWLVLSFCARWLASPWP